MYLTTPDYQNEMTAPARHIYGKVAIDFTDPFVDQSIQVTANENSNISKPEQTANSVSVPHGKIISLDGSWELGDGSVLADDKKEIGWWGKQLSAAGELTAGARTYTVTINFATYDTITIDGVTLTAGIDFIKSYESAATLEYLVPAINNNAILGAKYVASQTGYNNLFTLTEKILGGGNTPSEATYTGTVVILSGAPTESAAGDGMFSAPYPTLTIEHASRPIHSLKVVGDSIREEYPVDFTIGLYDASNVLLHTETVTGNTLISWNKTLDEPITAVTKQVLTISKWSHEGRQVKILEFFTSIQKIFEGDDIFAINLIEEREISSGSLPVGNISANEIDIRLYNRDRIFDAGNTESPIYNTVKPNRKIRPYLGIEDEFVPLGVFWSGNWKVPEGELYAETSGRDRLELLRQSTFSSSEIYVDTDLYDLAEIVLQDAGLTSEEYFIDTDLQTFTVPYAYFTSQSHREALRKIAEACLGQVYCDRDGIVRIEGLSYLDGAISELTITGDEYFNKDNPSDYDKIANYIEVETQPLKPDIAEEVYASNEPENITLGQVKSQTIFYNTEPCQNAAATVTGNATLTSAIYYAWGARITVTGTADGTFEISVTAEPLRVLNKQKAIASDDGSISENGRLRYIFPENPLVQTLSVAQTIANNLLASFKNPRRDLSMEWRGNPALLLGDRITVQDSNEENDYFITKQELEYDGGLRARLEGRRA